MKMNLFSWFSGLFQRSIENPSTPLSSPDDWLYDALGSYRASSGVNVNHQTALTYAAVWRAVNLIAGDVAKIPVFIYRNLQEGGKAKAVEHPAFFLLRRMANEEMTAYVFKKTLLGHALLHGNGYAYIFRANNGSPREMIPLQPNTTYPIRQNGQLMYVTQMLSGELRKLFRENVFHIKGLSFDGLIGYSVIEKARESLGLGMALQTYGSIFFRNNARPNIVLQHPAKLDEATKSRLRDSWERIHSGLENAHRTAILDSGLQVKELSINAKDSQFIESRQFEIREVANWFGIPPHKLGDTTRTSYKSLEQENQAYLDEALDHWLTNFEEEAWTKLLTEEEKRSEQYHVEFFRRALVRADLEQRGKYYSSALQNGWMNRDEIRDEENLNPLPDNQGKRFFIPLNMQLTDVMGTTPEKDEDDIQSDSSNPTAINIDGGSDGGQLLDVPDIRQEFDYDCGAAACLAIANYFRIGPQSLGEMRDILNTEKKNGTELIRMIDFFNANGLSVTSGQGWTIEDLKQFFLAKMPVICAIQAYGSPADERANRSGHYVVVIGLALGQIVLQDPSSGRRIVPELDFESVWHDKDENENILKKFGIAVGRKPTILSSQINRKEAAKIEGDKKELEEESRNLLNRDFAIDTIRRMVRRIGHQADRHSKNSKHFLKWMDEFKNDNSLVVFESFARVLPSDATSLFFEHIHEQFERIVESVSEKHLHDAVISCMQDMETSLPLKILNQLKGLKNANSHPKT